MSWQIGSAKVAQWDMVIRSKIADIECFFSVFARMLLVMRQTVCCGGVFSSRFAANLLRNLSVKEL